MASRRMLHDEAKKRPLLLSKGKEPPPSATTSMLEAMLDGKKQKKRRKKQASSSQRKKDEPPNSNANSTTTTTSSFDDSSSSSMISHDHKVLASGGLSDAPVLFAKKSVRGKSLLDSVPMKRLDSSEKENTTKLKKAAPNVASLEAKKSETTSIRSKVPPNKKMSLTLQVGGSKKRRLQGPPPVSAHGFDAAAAASNSIQAPKEAEVTEKAERMYNLPRKSSSVEEAPIVDVAPPDGQLSRDPPSAAAVQLEADRIVERSHKVTADTTNTGDKLDKTSKKKTAVNNDNFVRLNLRNSAGACRGARRSKSFRGRRKSDQQVDSSGAPAKRKGQRRRTAQSGVDPLDDFVDGVFQPSKQPGPSNDSASRAVHNAEKAPMCARHQRSCKLLTVKKNTGNKGRKFYVCSLPRGEQCDHFEWADDTVEAAQQALLRKSSHSGFVARQVAAYTERFKTLTVPELREEAKRRKLNHVGKRQQLLTRLSLWVRDELAQVTGDEPPEEQTTKDEVQQDINDEVSDDDSFSDESCESSSEEELELLHPEEGPCQPPLSLRTTEATVDMEREAEIPAENVGPASTIQQLKRLFGHSNFRDGQEWAIQRCLDFQRTLIVAPTGFGKSLCYALPASMMEGVCIVVSPLISLMQDQLRQLPPRIPAATLSGSLSASAMVSTIDDVLRDRIKILFVSPERLASPSFRRLFRWRWNPETNTRERQFPGVSLLCVDEAHCLSQWGHNFRPSYLRLRSMVDQLQPRSVLAMTATAGPRVISDICKALRIPTDESVTENDLSPDGAGLRILGCKRDNIDVSCTILDSEEQRLIELLRLLTKESGKDKARKSSDDSNSMENGCLSKGSTIVYVWRQRDAEVVAENLVSHGVAGGVVVYHGGMDAAARAKAQSKFMRGKARICVATVAFGLGINKADISAVVHLYLPASPENYLQETGRAGRDGRNARAVALVLREEVVVRHSMAHSDLLCTSQIGKVLQIIRELILTLKEDAASNNSPMENRGTPLSIALPIESAVLGVDCKSETVETLLSIVEDLNPDQPLLRVEGTIMDEATITLKKRPLEKLAATEQIANYIMKCAFRIDAQDRSIADQDMEDEPHTMQQAFLAYSFGSYRFSIAQCASLIGPNAEPRHVFATLRRLQNTGELELLLDSKSNALHLLMDPKGIEFFSGEEASMKKLAETLAVQVKSNVAAAAEKALHIDAMLKQVATEDTNDHDEDQADSSKSSSLRLFQDLTTRYFSGEDIMSRCDGDKLPADVPEESLRDISIDISQLLRDLPLSPEFQPRQKNSSWFLHLQQPDSSDYTALSLSKFLHGLESPRASYSAFRRHALFGKWRRYRFSSLLKCIEAVLEKKA